MLHMRVNDLHTALGSLKSSLGHKRFLLPPWTGMSKAVQWELRRGVQLYLPIGIQYVLHVRVRADIIGKSSFGGKVG